MRKEFSKQLKAHDWYYSYSDDHNVWERGKRQLQNIVALYNSTNCPFELAELRMWANGMIVGPFAEEGPDEWYLQPRKYKCTAPVKREGLITQATSDEIEVWLGLENNDGE
jgi:hypothetical protein